MRDDTYKMPSYYGDSRLDADGTQEAIGQIASVVGATLVGIDKSNQDDIDYVDMLRTFYRPSLGIATNQPTVQTSPAGQTDHHVGHSYWYTTAANVLYYMLGAQYPNATNMTEMLRSIADTFCDQVVALGGSSADFDGQGFNFSTRTKNAGDRNEGGDGQPARLRSSCGPMPSSVTRSTSRPPSGRWTTSSARTRVSSTSFFRSWRHTSPRE